MGESASKFFYVTIESWKKYNPRTDRSNFSWFRFENGFFEDPEVYELGADEQRAYIYILCEVSKNNGNESKLSYNRMSDTLRIKKVKLVEIIGALVSARLLAVSAPSASQPMFPLRDETNERTNDNAQPEVSLDFESIYSLYPRKAGKKEGLDWLSKHITTKKKFTEVVKAVRNYKAQQEKEGAEIKFYKHFSSFLNCYEDYANSDSPPPRQSLPDCCVCGNDGRMQGRGKKIEEVGTFRCECKHGERFKVFPLKTSKPDWKFSRL